MGFMDRLRSRSSRPDSRDLPPDHDVKGWTVRFTPKGGTAGWRKIDEWELLDEPVTKTEFELNTGDLDPGTYALFWIQADTERLQSPPEAVAWKKEIEADTDPGDDHELDPDAIADKAAQRTLAALQQDDGLTPEERVARQRAIIQLALLNNEEFVAKHGEAIALAEFGINETGDGLSFDEYENNPIGAFLYDTYKDPKQMREFGTHLGAGGGAFFEGLLEGAEDPEAVLEEEIEQAQAEAADADGGEGFEPTPSRADAITSLDDLTDRVDNELADELAATTVGFDEPNTDATADAAGAHAGAATTAEDDGGEPPPNPEAATMSNQEPDADDDPDAADLDAEDPVRPELTDEDLDAATEGL